MTQGNKRLIVCCDGTWNEPDEKVDNNPADETEATNVLKVVRGIAPVDRHDIPQVVYYDAGVGTQGFLDRYVGGGFGRGISENIQQAYRFIANNYHEGDELFLFGFSRGAYTVRSLAGFIGSVGLLAKAHLRRVPEAYALYRTPPDKRPGSLPEQRLKNLQTTTAARHTDQVHRSVGHSRCARRANTDTGTFYPRLSQFPRHATRQGYPARLSSAGHRRAAAAIPARPVDTG